MTTPYQEREDQLLRLASQSNEHLLRGEFVLGEEAAREFLELAEDASESWHSLAHLRLGTILENAGRCDEALTHAIAAQNLHSPADPGWYHATGLLGKILLNQGDIDSARDRFLSVLEFWPDSAFAMCSLSAVESNLGDIDCSRSYAVRALESACKTDDREHMSVAHNMLGDAELDSENHVQAEEHFRNALAISEELGRRRGISIACQRLSKIESSRENYDAALEFGRRAVNVEKEMGRTSEVRNACWRAVDGLRKAEQPDVLLGAISLCQIAFEAATDPADKVWPLQSEAWFHRDLKQFHQAEKLLAQALTLVEEADEENARIHGQIGILKKDREDFVGAKEYFLRSVKLAERYGHEKALQSAYGSLGYLSSGTGKTVQARSYWQRALKLAQDSGSEKDVSHWLETLELNPPTLMGWVRDILTWKRSS